MYCNIIGAGRLGANIALALSAAGQIQLNNLCNFRKENAQKIAIQIGSGIAVTALTDLGPADVTFITTPDDILPHIVNQLATMHLIQKDSLVVHCSGVLTADVLNPLREQGCFVASLHPAKSFPAGYLSATAFYKIPCIIEGDNQALSWLQHSFNILDATLIPIAAQNKVLYHAACVMASNYIVTLAAKTNTLLLDCGIPTSQAAEIAQSLMQGAVQNLASTTNPAIVLTGPISRGDKKTINLHLQALKAYPDIAQLYKYAGLATVDLTSLDAEKKQELVNLLTE